MQNKHFMKRSWKSIHQNYITIRQTGRNQAVKKNLMKFWATHDSQFYTDIELLFFWSAKWSIERFLLKFLIKAWYFPKCIQLTLQFRQHPNMSTWDGVGWAAPSTLWEGGHRCQHVQVLTAGHTGRNSSAMGCAEKENAQAAHLCKRILTKWNWISRSKIIQDPGEEQKERFEELTEMERRRFIVLHHFPEYFESCFSKSILFFNPPS